MRTSGHLARTPVRRRVVARREARRSGGGEGVRRLGGRAGELFRPTGRRRVPGRRRSGLLNGGGSGLTGWAGGNLCAAAGDGAARPEAEGFLVRWGSRPGPCRGRQRNGRMAVVWRHPRPKAGPGLSYLFKRRPPPAPPRSRGLTRRVVSKLPRAGEGSMTPRPRPSRPHRGRARWGRPLPSPIGQSTPGLPRATRVEVTAATVAPRVRTADPADAGAPPRVGRAP